VGNQLTPNWAGGRSRIDSTNWRQAVLDFKQIQRFRRWA
jgi:hypothetical protein